MSSIQSVDPNGWRIRSIRTFTSLLLFVSIIFVCGAATAAEEEGSENAKEDDFWYAITHGKPTLDMRPRIEIADVDNKGADGQNRSEAYTLRTRLGYGTKPWKGLMAYAEGENITAVAGGQYNDGTEGGSGKTVIADPTKTEVNQVYFNLNRKDWLDTNVTLGRQRIILDDSRFVGNVGWRQNEQTFDAVRGSTSLGVEDLNASYAYMRYARRIFGDKDQGTTAQKDWRTNNHVVHVAYTGFDEVDITGFAYIFEFNRAQANSSATVGFRLTGDSEITDDLKLIYETSYAFQTDYDNNPNDYDTHYFMGQLKLAESDLGAFGVGYELLGSDDGDGQFRTPLATAHKFNGWADVFLNNGGANGLQDLFGSISPKLPWKLKGSLVYHHFWSHEDGKSIGDEIDIVLKRPINKYLSVLTKAAYFDGSDNNSTAGTSVPNNIWRWWLQADFKF
jgi:hypothetical protein